MKISRIEIGNFGKFSNYILELSSGFQVIHGWNEDGKTTLMSFLNMMFYSDQGRAQNVDQNLRKKYMPWNGQPMEGALTFSWDGTNYHLSKSFGDTPSRDSTTLTNLDTGEEVLLNHRQEVGEKFFGLDRAGFQRSSYIGQIGSIDSGTSTDDVAEKLLSNLVDSGDEEVSHQEVVKRLEDAKYQLISRNKTRGILAEAQGDLQELGEEEDQVRRHPHNQKELEEEYQQVAASYKKLEELEQIEKSHQALQQMEKLDQLIQRRESLDILKEKLSTPLYTPENLPQLLRQGDALLQRQQELEQGLLPLTEAIASQTSVEITPEEYQELSKAAHRLQSLETMETEWNTEVLPTHNTFTEKTNELQQLELHLSSLKERVSTLSQTDALKTTQEQTLIKTREQRSQKEEQLRGLEELWVEQEQAKTQQISSLTTQYELFAKERKKGISFPLLLLGLVLIAGFGVVGFLLQALPLPLVGLGGLAGVLCVVLSFVVGKDKQNQEQLQELTDKIEHGKEELSQWESAKEEKKQQLADDITTLWEEEQELEKLLATEPDTQELHQLEEQLSGQQDMAKQLTYQLDGLQMSLEKSQQKLVALCQREQLPQLEQLEAPFTQWDFRTLTISLQKDIQKLEETIQHMLEGKELSSMEEFTTAYQEQQGQSSQRKKIHQLEEQLQENQKDFLATLSLHTPVDDVDSAKNLLASLFKGLNAYEQLEKEVQLTASTLSLEDSSLPTLKAAKEELEVIGSSTTSLSPLELSQEIQSLKNQNLVEEMQRLQQQIQSPSRNLEEIAKEIRELEEQVGEMDRYYQGVSLALDTMNRAQEEMRKSFGPLLNETTSRIFSALTGEKYETLTVDKEYNINVKSGVHFREWRYLSHGTIDQAYLALRLAVSLLIAPEGGQLPLFLDDTLMQYDDHRSQLALEFLEEHSQEHGIQILLFSCHRRMVTMGNELGITSYPLLEA